jgi:hypothetical protein
MIWKKLERQGGFLLPESMLDVRETCRRKGVHPSPETPLDGMKKLLADDFGAQIGIWGSVERVPGHSEDVYDLVIKCADFSAADAPKMIYECKTRTKTVSEIPHVYVKQLLDALYGKKPETPAGRDLIAEENWKKNSNLVVGGDFEAGKDGVPQGWESVAGQQRERLGGLVRWVPESGSAGNRVIRFSFPAEVGDNEGVMYYCLPFAVEEGATYRFQCRWRTNGPAVKVFIKCYDEIGSEYRRTGASPSASEQFQAREVYRSQQNLKGPKNTWNVHTEDFTPRHTQYAPHWGRVMLYAYVGAGVVDFDDIVVKKIASGSTGQTSNKVRRHSTETKTVEP